MIDQIKLILGTKTISHSIITVSGTVINGILGILFFILLARNLGPEKFGLLSVSIAIFTLVSDIADLGVNTSLINFVSKFLKEDTDKAYRFMKLGLEIKLVTGVCVAILGWILSPFIAENIFLKPELVSLLQLMMIGVITSLAFSFITNSLQAFQQFLKWAMLNIFINSVRLMLILILILSLTLSLQTVLISYLGVLALGFFIGLFLLPLNFLKIKSERSVGRSFFGFSKWIAIFIFLAAVSSRLDIFIATRLVSISQVGIYSVATQLSSIVPQLVFAVASVIAPKLGSFNNDQEAIKYIKKTQLFVFSLFILGLITIPFSAYLIPVFYGDLYKQSILPFTILFIAQLLFLMAIPSQQTIIYYFAKPQISVIFVLTQILIVALVGWILILKFGIVGAAITIFVENVFNFILPGLYVIYQFKHRKLKK